MFVEAEIWNPDKYDYVKFDSDVLFFFLDLFCKYCPKNPFGILMLPD